MSISFHHLRKHGDRSESRKSINLIEINCALIKEIIHPRKVTKLEPMVKLRRVVSNQANLLRRQIFRSRRCSGLATLGVFLFIGIEGPGTDNLTRIGNLKFSIILVNRNLDLTWLHSFFG